MEENQIQEICKLGERVKYKTLALKEIVIENQKDRLIY